MSTFKSSTTVTINIRDIESLLKTWYIDHLESDPLLPKREEFEDQVSYIKALSSYVMAVLEGQSE